MAGLRILMDGGNAVDAAVATAAALNVVEPMSTGVGGDVFALIWMANEKEVRALNASGRAPGGASLDELRSKGLSEMPDQSPYSVTVPGAVSGWQAALDRYGKMTLSEVLKPAIEYASNGYPVSDVISSLWEASAPRLRIQPSGNEMLLNGRVPRPGDMMKMPGLANVLRQIADGGADAYYKGEPAKKVADFIQGLGGWLSVDDMANHKATWEEPISTDYRGHSCWQCPPNSQGVNVLMALNLVEGFDIASMGFQSPDTWHHLIESIRLAFADGLYHITDPSKSNVPTDTLISKSYASNRRALIQAKKAMGAIETGPVLAHSDTVYLSCVDGDGNACSFINSIFRGFGSGLVVPGTGIALHNRGASFSLDSEHPNALAPDKRPYHTLIPGMVTKDGELKYTYGVMGAMQQAQGHLQVLVNMIDFGLGPQEALDAPRFSVRLGEGVAIEDLVPMATQRDLEGRGHPMMRLTPNGNLFGSGQIIARDHETGVLTGGSEPRQDGFAVGW
jgi:gamma-glutamyltranspeptidase/glutathione hydrolase